MNSNFFFTFLIYLIPYWEQNVPQDFNVFKIGLVKKAHSNKTKQRNYRNSHYLTIKMFQVDQNMLLNLIFKVIL